MKGQNQHSYTGNAAERKRQAILSEVLADSSQAFFQKNLIKPGMHGLDLGCGVGKVTLQLKALVGEKGKMTGLDINPTFIEIAREKAAQQCISGVEYYCMDMVDGLQGNITLPDKYQQIIRYDFIYSRLFLNRLHQAEKILAQVYDWLKPGGFAMIEELDFSNCSSFPNCHAFDRYIELYLAIKKRQGLDVNLGGKLFSLFQQANFNDIQVQLKAPIFLKEQHKNLPSLTLESIGEDLVQAGLVVSAELSALLAELKAFEHQDHTLISLPGIYQSWGFKL